MLFKKKHLKKKFKIISRCSEKGRGEAQQEIQIITNTFINKLFKKKFYQKYFLKINYILSLKKFMNSFVSFCEYC